MTPALDPDSLYLPTAPVPYTPHTDLPKIGVMCSTYCRPDQLANALACYASQDYPLSRRELVILDDAGQYDNQDGPGWRLVSTPYRFRTLGEKRNACAALLPADVDILAVLDDDDVYLPHWLSTLALAFLSAPSTPSPTSPTPTDPTSQPDQPTSPTSPTSPPDPPAGQRADHPFSPEKYGLGWVNRRTVVPSHLYVWNRTGFHLKRNPSGIFHGSWAFSRKLFDEVSGYPFMQSGQDQVLMGRFRSYVATLPSDETNGWYRNSLAIPVGPFGSTPTWTYRLAPPYYIYRWFAEAPDWHLSALSRTSGYESQADRPKPWIGRLHLRFSRDWPAAIAGLWPPAPDVQLP